MGCTDQTVREITDPAPTYVDLMQDGHWCETVRPDLGPSYKPFRPDLSSIFSRPLEPGMVGEPFDWARTIRPFVVERRANADRLASRNTLLAGLDKIRREVDATGMMDAMDRFSQQATGIRCRVIADALIYRKKIRRLLSSISQMERYQ